MKKTSKNITRVTLAMAALLVTIAASAGAAWAVFSSVSATAENSLSAGVVACQVEEEFDGVTKDAIAVVNTGTATSYVRVRIVSYWVDESGQPVGMAVPDASISLGEGWTQGKDGCYYAKAAVAPGAETPSLLAAPFVLAKSSSYRQVVDVLAEAIQAQPADAAAEAWGATVADGTLVPQM